MKKLVVVTDSLERFLSSRPAGFKSKYEVIHVTSKKEVDGADREAQAVIFGKVSDEGLAEYLEEVYGSVIRL